LNPKATIAHTNPVMRFAFAETHPTQQKKRSQKTPLPNSEFTTLNYTAANKLAAAAFKASALSVSKADPNPVAQSDHRPPHLGRTVHPDRPH
jgi:hypothetical protein